ncbi:unnamed protein product [Didymodactylos carnosus]|nr:unnamed protein product [Didymodactylos carnosus]CAF4542755.1 unnamed protein product [Didymodactylos carnosus]
MLDDVYNDLVNKYGDGIVDVKRMFNGNGQPMRSIRVEFDSSEQVARLLDDGLMVIWHERKTVKEYYLPMICFVCESVGHRSSACPKVEPCNECQQRHYFGKTTCDSTTNNRLRMRASVSSYSSSPIDSETASNTSSIIPSTANNNNISVDSLLAIQASKFENMLNALEIRMSTRISKLEKQTGELFESSE